MGHDLTIEDAEQLAEWAKEQKMVGVMTWDLNRDAAGVGNEMPFAYTNVIEESIWECSLL